MGRTVSDLDIRPYSQVEHFDSVRRSWLEVGWVEESSDSDSLAAFFGAGNASVGMLNGAAEVFAHWTPGRIRYDSTDLALGAVTAVTTSRIARKQGFATEMTARALADAAANGASVSILGMFDQGFYDRLGFGTGPYEHHWTFDPASLRVDTPYRTPARLGPDDWEAIHQCVSNRMRVHGEVALDPAGIMKGELSFMDNAFGLGYWEGDTLTHCVVGSAKGESGPYSFDFFGYQNHEQLLELLRLIRELGDQVSSVSMVEPAGLQIQDLLDRPRRQRSRTRKSDHETVSLSIAWWQIRLLDVAACVSARRWLGPPVTFQLRLHDPLGSLLDGPWQGVGGNYVVELGPESSATSAEAAGLPTLEADIGAFSRLWFGVRTARALGVTDKLSGPESLLRRLDEAVSLPVPTVGMPF